MSINANTSVLEYERLTAERTQARLARKAINRRRYLRRYYRIRGKGTPLAMVRVADFVVVTVEPFPIHIPDYPLNAYGPIGSDRLLP